jgi:hypothetical protein
MASSRFQRQADLQARLQKAAQFYWDTRNKQAKKQRKNRTKVDTGLRSAVTAGKHMLLLESLICEVLAESGVPEEHIFRRSALELPGFFRPEKKWDIVVVADNTLVAAFELKSQAGPSFGNNGNNRTEEALGNAADLATAYREGRLTGNQGFRPLVGYFFLLEDCEAVHKPRGNEEPHFPVDPIFKGSSYCKRYELLCKRLVQEKFYDVACLTLSTNEKVTRCSHPSADLSFELLAASIRAQVGRWNALRELRS